MATQLRLRSPVGMVHGVLRLPDEVDHDHPGPTPWEAPSLPGCDAMCCCTKALSMAIPAGAGASQQLWLVISDDGGVGQGGGSYDDHRRVAGKGLWSSPLAAASEAAQASDGARGRCARSRAERETKLKDLRVNLRSDSSTAVEWRPSAAVVLQGVLIVGDGLQVKAETISQVLQYMCEKDNPGLRDGTKRGNENTAGGEEELQGTSTTEKCATDSGRTSWMINKHGLDRRKIEHLFFDRKRERQKGLYTADQNVNDNRGATATRLHNAPADPSDAAKDLITKFAYIDQQTNLCDIEENDQNSVQNCKQLNGLVKMKTVGAHKARAAGLLGAAGSCWGLLVSRHGQVVSTRNNDFSNRSQKATINVVPRGWRMEEAATEVVGVGVGVPWVPWIGGATAAVRQEWKRQEREKWRAFNAGSQSMDSPGKAKGSEDLDDKDAMAEPARPAPSRRCHHPPDPGCCAARPSKRSRLMNCLVCMGLGEGATRSDPPGPVVNAT
eukprot:Skav213989  [mRNA]  locus=scaffold2843:78534:105364:+ [translate_table: standard]